MLYPVAYIPCDAAMCVVSQPTRRPLGARSRVSLTIPIWRLSATASSACAIPATAASSDRLITTTATTRKRCLLASPHGWFACTSPTAGRPTPRRSRPTLSAALSRSSAGRSLFPSRVAESACAFSSLPERRRPTLTTTRRRRTAPEPRRIPSMRRGAAALIDECRPAGPLAGRGLIWPPRVDKSRRAHHADETGGAVALPSILPTATHENLAWIPITPKVHRAPIVEGGSQVEAGFPASTRRAAPSSCVFSNLAHSKSTCREQGPSFCPTKTLPAGIPQVRRSDWRLGCTAVDKVKILMVKKP